MRILMDLEQLLKEQIEQIIRKGDVTPVELERLDDAIDIIKDIETICAMKEYGYQEEEGGYSERYPYYARSRRGGGGSYNYRREGGGNSGAGNYMMNPRYYRDDRSYNSSYDDMAYARDGRSYNEGSYEQGRSNNSRGYSGHANKEDLKKELQEMMNKAGSEKERVAIQQFLEQWKD